MIKIVILGSSGFIGRALTDALSKANLVIPVTREKLSSTLSQLKNIDVVVNCLGSAASASVSDAYNSNFRTPENILKDLTSIGREIGCWIQLRSYYELQIPLGRSDSYSSSKLLFWQRVKELSVERSFVARSVLLPHIFGKQEESDRLLSILRRAVVQSKFFELSEGSQLLPILELEDTCTGIEKFISTDITNVDLNPFWYGSVRELVYEIESATRKSLLVRFGLEKSIDAKFGPVTFDQSGLVFDKRINDIHELVKAWRAH